MQTTEQVRQNHSPLQKEEWRPILIVAGIFFTLCLAIALNRYFTFYASYDQGIFNQVMWNSAHGRWFESTLSSQLSTNVVHAQEIPSVSYRRLGQHFTPALLLWLPIYKLFPHAFILVVLLVTAIAAAGLVLYILAREYLPPAPARWITFGYYGANAIIGPALGNFNDNFQLPLFVFTLLLAMEKRWWWLFAAMGVCILAIREDAGLVLFGVGFYMLISRRFPLIGSAVCAVSFGYVLAATNIIMPLFSDDISKRFMLEQFGQFTDAPEASTVDIIWAMLSNPGVLLKELFTPTDRTISYLAGHFLPYALIPAIAPSSWVITGAPLLNLLLGKGNLVLTLHVRYALAIVPGVCYGTILWWSGETFQNFFRPSRPRTIKTISPFFRRFWLTCICLSIFFTAISSPNRSLYFAIPDSFDPWIYVSPAQQWKHSQNIRQIMGQIPKDASVAATRYIVPQLSSRREIIRVPDLQILNDENQIDTVDYIVIDFQQLIEYQPAFDGDWEDLNNYPKIMQSWLDEDLYDLMDFRSGVILLAKTGLEELNPEGDRLWKDYYQTQILPIISEPRD
ncbi:Protein of unknown function DUF2079, membrane [[Leptolyngbya] sp. PCC 7376]|uniref:DUF2079 domain-containing protein n=1 Tax=[Leptolyngbya] sp. PCC 7376 TaxID=111781 RepID=UPI00029EDFA1|nr:DUF2079 domain-containing protein [[Leptolyngbya] sp. PCC 7376]AFY38511.1 Protein of unknown function DUF2079, membrane [[Leptolyngbya] sp. PCC 7376]